MSSLDQESDIYGSPDYQYTSSGNIGEAVSDSNDTFPQEHPEGDYATPDDLTGYRHNAGHTDDYLNQKPGLFRVNRPSPEYFVSVPRQIIGASGIVIPGSGRITGINVWETAGAAATVRLRSGLDANQPVIGTFALPANGSTFTTFAHPIEFKAGLFLEIVNGNVAGTVLTLESRRK